MSHSIRGRSTLVTILAVLSIFSACSGDNGAGPAPPDDRIGPDGGTVVLADGAVTLTIPAGALAEPVELTATRMESPASSAGLIPGTAWDLGPDGLEFGVPVRLTLKYDRARVPQALVESSLAIGELEDEGWLLQGEPTLDSNAGTVTASIDGFSGFAVLATRMTVTLQTTTDGEDPDADGYSISVLSRLVSADGFKSRAEDVDLGPNDTRLVEALIFLTGEDGKVFVAFEVVVAFILGSLQKNCSLEGSPTRSIDTASEPEPREIFPVHCTAIPLAAVQLESVIGDLQAIVVLGAGGSPPAVEGVDLSGLDWLSDAGTGETTIEYDETDAGGTTTIKSVKPDGTDKKTIVETGSGDDHSVHVRPPHRYYSSAGDIERMNLDGSGRTKLTSGDDYDLYPVLFPGLGLFFLRIPADAEQPFQARIFRLTDDGELVGPLTDEFAFSFSRPAILPPRSLVFARHPRADRLEVSLLDLETGGVTDITAGGGSEFFLDPAVGAGGRGAMSRIDAEGELRLLINRHWNAFRGGGTWIDGPPDLFQSAWQFPAEVDEAAGSGSAARRVLPARAAITDPGRPYRLRAGETPFALRRLLELVATRIPAELAREGRSP